MTSTDPTDTVTAGETSLYGEFAARALAILAFTSEWDSSTPEAICQAALQTLGMHPVDGLDQVRQIAHRFGIATANYGDNEPELHFRSNPSEQERADLNRAWKAWESASESNSGDAERSAAVDLIDELLAYARIEKP